MNFENTSTEGVTDVKIEIKDENESYDEVKRERDLYADHVIKQEVVIGPVVLQEVDVTYCPEDVPTPKKPKLETTDEETDQDNPQGMKTDNTEGFITNADFYSFTNIKTNKTYCAKLKTSGLSGNVLTCNECGKKFQEVYKLTQHVKRHRKKLSCPHCDYKTNRKWHLSQHLRIHTGEKPYSCSHCDFKSNRKSHLSTHLLMHTGKIPRHRTNIDETPFSCLHCDYKCEDKSNLTQHLLTHSGEKPYKCSL